MYIEMDQERIERLPHTKLLTIQQLSPDRWCHIRRDPRDITNWVYINDEPPSLEEAVESALNVIHRDNLPMNLESVLDHLPGYYDNYDVGKYMHDTYGWRYDNQGLLMSTERA